MKHTALCEWKAQTRAEMCLIWFGHLIVFMYRYNCLHCSLLYINTDTLWCLIFTHIHSHAAAFWQLTANVISTRKQINFTLSRKLSKNFRRRNGDKPCCTVPPSWWDPARTHTFTGTHTHTIRNRQTSRLEPADPSPQTKLYHKSPLMGKPMTSSRRSRGLSEKQFTVPKNKGERGE